MGGHSNVRRLIQYVFSVGCGAIGGFGFPVVEAAESNVTAPEVEVLGTYETGVGTSDSASQGRITARRC